MVSQPPRMATLDGLLELLGIAEKHHVSGGGAGRRFRLSAMCTSESGAP